MKTYSPFLFALILSFGLNQFGFSQYDSQVAHLNAYVAEAAKSYNIPGLSIGIVKDGKVIFSKGYGLLDSEEKTAVDEESVYAIASLSKAFTTAAIGMLVDEGKLDWDDKVVDHLPNFQLHDPYVTANITVKDLLSHRCGLATFDGDLLWYGTNYSREEIIERIKYLPLKQEFRSEFGYQNIMYIAAGELVEAVSGEEWDVFLNKRIFKPLSMKRTASNIHNFDGDRNVTLPHLKGKAIGHLNYHNSGATASLNSTIDDLNAWILFWMSKGKIEDQQLLSESSMKMIHASHTPLNVSSFDAKNGVHFKSYGLGWFTMDYKGNKVIHHGGGLPGYISKIALVPDMDLGLIVLTNDMSSLPSALMYKIIDVFADENMEEGRDWAGEFLEYGTKYEESLAKKKEERQASRVENTQPTIPLDSLIGAYTDEMYGNAFVTKKEGKMMIVLEPTKELFVSALEHWHYDTYRIKFNDPFLPEGFVTFSADSRRKITHFTIDLPNPDFHFFNLEFKPNPEVSIPDDLK